MNYNTLANIPDLTVIVNFAAVVSIFENVNLNLGLLVYFLYFEQ